MVTTVQPLKSLDPPPQMGASDQLPKPVDSRGHEESSECQKEDTCSSSPSVSSEKTLLQMVKAVKPPISVDSSPQMVTPVQPPKSVDSRRTSCVSESVVSDSGAAPFDICRRDSKYSLGAKPYLFEINREIRRARELSKSAAALQYLRPGMVLLKNFLKSDDQVQWRSWDCQRAMSRAHNKPHLTSCITCSSATDQVKIIKQCRELGVGTGGFYQPCYKDGSKLSLQMMCLGKNWDPDSCSYVDILHSDGAQPPKIPEELTKFVKDAIEASHAFLKQCGQGTSNPSKEIPWMSPDICIVNFYTTAGKLGLHKDKAETQNSLTKGLPVVSFSLGDTAEFLYGDAKDEAKASKIKLESGGVLIFGGQSRHIFHRVSSITPKTAPTRLTQEANLRPGRLNLTFRQY